MERIVITSKIAQKRKLFDCDFGGKMKPAAADKDNLECRDKSKIIAIFGISDCGYSNAKNKIDKIFIDNVFTTKKLLLVTLIEEMKPLAMSDK